MIYEELRSLEIARGDANIVLLSRMVKLGQTPVDQSQLAVGVVDHDVMRFDVSMHDALRVAKIKRLQNLENVVPDVEVIECRVQLSEVSITCVDELCDYGRRLG